jgi:hypothetical protein
MLQSNAGLLGGRTHDMLIGTDKAERLVVPLPLDIMNPFYGILVFDAAADAIRYQSGR